MPAARPGVDTAPCFGTRYAAALMWAAEQLQECAKGGVTNTCDIILFSDGELGKKNSSNPDELAADAPEDVEGTLKSLRKNLPAVNIYGTRVNVEIYNMPSFMARQTPPLSPEAGISTALYFYASPTEENAETGILYPLTADGQPGVILRKASTQDRDYSRAICGFELWKLRASSHLALADFVLLRHFRLGLPDAP